MKKSKKKILIVDDSTGWLEYHIAALIKVLGDEYTLDTASSARKGYDAIYNHLKDPYSLIISDLQMEMDFEPKHAGEWFVEQVKQMKEYKNTPVVIMSAAYNIRTIAKKLQVNCLPKAIAARDLTAYSFAIKELLNH